jgi:hypothetical protein
MGNLFKQLLEALIKYSAKSKPKPKPKPKLGQALKETEPTTQFQTQGPPAPVSEIEVPYKERGHSSFSGGAKKWPDRQGHMDTKHPRPEGEELSPGQEQAFLERMLIEGGMTPEDAKAQFGPYRGGMDFEKGMQEQAYPDRFPISQLDRLRRGQFTTEGYKEWPDRKPFALQGDTNAPVIDAPGYRWRDLPYTRGVFGEDPLVKDKSITELGRNILRDLGVSEDDKVWAEFLELSDADKLRGLVELLGGGIDPIAPETAKELSNMPMKQFDRSNKDMAKFMKTFQKLMGKGSPTLNTALIGAGVGAGGLGGALRDQRRSTAGGAPQPPSR